MGITIHYNLSFKGSESDLIAKLETVRQYCLDLPFKSVENVEALTISQKDVNDFHNRKDNESYEASHSAGIGQIIDVGKHREDKQERTSWQKYNCPIRLISFSVWAGQRCESSDFNFNKHKHDRIWRCRSFTKTQYAEEFVKCHLLTVKVLDLMKDKAGLIIDKVNDEGDFYETRDLAELAKKINDVSNLYGQKTNRMVWW